MTHPSLVIICPNIRLLGQDIKEFSFHYPSSHLYTQIPLASCEKLHLKSIYWHEDFKLFRLFVSLLLFSKFMAHSWHYPMRCLTSSKICAAYYWSTVLWPGEVVNGRSMYRFEYIGCTCWSLRLMSLQILSILFLVGFPDFTWSSNEGLVSLFYHVWMEPSFVVSLPSLPFDLPGT